MPEKDKHENIQPETCGAENPASFFTQINKSKCREDIADRNGLKCIGERMELLEIQIQEVTLNNPPKEEQQGESFEKFEMERFTRPFPFPVLCHRERDCRP